MVSLSKMGGMVLYLPLTPIIMNALISVSGKMDISEGHGNN